MKIGITGASGHLGAATLEHLKKRVGASAIVGISRTPQKVAALGVEAREGDFDRPESLANAFAGLDRLLLIPTSDLRPGVRTRQGTTAIQHAVAAGIEHVVFMSTLGARAAEVPHLWESYFVPEQALMRAAKKWSILRMAYYIESLVDEARMSLGSGVHASLSATPVNFVARDDLAAAAAGLLATEGHHGAIYQGTGPASFSGEERAAAMSKASGKTVAFAQVSRDQYEGGLKAAGLPPDLIAVILSIQAMWAAGGFDVVTGDIERLSGRRPRDLVEVMTAALRTPSSN